MFKTVLSKGLPAIRGIIPAPRRSISLPKPMSSSAAYTESWASGPQSTQFCTRTYTPSTPPRALLVAIHGFAEHIGRYTHFHPLLSQHGIAVFAIDQRGFGKTAQDTEGNKSKHSAYGKTSWKEQMDDIDWAIKHAREVFANTPTFLLGHSMGGGETLGFVTQGDNSPHHSTISSLAGVVVTSPLIVQAKPAPKLLRWAGGKASTFIPHSLIPVTIVPSHLSHDTASNEAYMKDPLIRKSGSLRGLHDMLSHGEALLDSYYKNWPPSLPVLFVHGTEDQVTSHVATQAFHDKITAHDKKITLFEGGFHELQNEPDGVKERLADEIVAFVEARLTATSTDSASKERSKM